MKHTAIDWLIIQIKNDHFDKALTGLEWMKIFDQAKQMEKQQIIESYCQGAFDISKDESIFPRETSEKYYNELYQSQNNE